MKITARLVVAACLLGSLAGCSATGAAPSASPTATARPTPASASESVPLPTVPAPAFGGDCSVVASDAEMSAATGGTLTASTTELVSDGDAAIRTLGGIRCVWDAEDGEGAWVTAIPVAAVGQDIIDEYSDGEPVCYSSDGGGGDQYACSFSTTVGEWWSAGVVYAALDSEVDPSDAIDVIVADFGTRASALSAVVPVKADGHWESLPDCDALESAVDTTPSVGVDLDATPGNTVAEAGPGFYGALDAAGQRSCFWQSNDDTVLIALLPGGWWVVDQAAARPGASVIQVAGVQRAIVVPGADGENDTLYLTDGANLARVEGSFSDEQRGALGSAVMAAVTR